MPAIFNIDYASLNDLTPPNYQIIPVDQILVDERVQREALATKLSTMAGKFSWTGIAASPIVVSKRGGKYIVLDGQHRKLLVEMQQLRPGTKEHTIGAMVFEDLTERQEAMLFLLLNDQSKVTPAAQFLVLVTAGETQATAVKEVIDRYGLRVGVGSNRDFAAVGAAMRIGRWADGLAVLNHTFDVLTQAFPDPIAPNRPLREEILTAVARIIHRYGTDITDGGIDVETAPRGRFVKMLQNDFSQKDASDAILNAAGVLRQGNGASKTLNAAAVLIMAYNNSVSKTYKVEPWDPKAESRRNMTEEGPEDTDA